MSLILDALRKSEAERRRGEAPGLHAPGAGAPPPPDAPGWRQWPVAAGGALLLLALAIFLWPRAEVAEPPADVVAPEPVVAAPPRLASPVAAPPPAPAPTQAPAPAAPVPIAPAPVAPATPAASAQPEVVFVPPAPAPEPPLPAPAAPADALPGLAVLPTAERAALPPLKLSMHVWNEDAARRFAIVDGQRLVEGARTGGAVVAEIRRDGVVLDVNGRRVLLPRP